MVRSRIPLLQELNGWIGGLPRTACSQGRRWRKARLLTEGTLRHRVARAMSLWGVPRLVQSRVPLSSELERPDGGVRVTGL